MKPMRQKEAKDSNAAVRTGLFRFRNVNRFPVRLGSGVPPTLLRWRPPALLEGSPAQEEILYVLQVCLGCAVGPKLWLRFGVVDDCWSFLLPIKSLTPPQGPTWLNSGIYLKGRGRQCGWEGADLSERSTALFL